MRELLVSLVLYLCLGGSGGSTIQGGGEREGHMKVSALPRP